MQPETLFSAANTLALVGWLSLLALPFRRAATWWLAGLAIPGLLAALYVVLLAVHAPGAEGGFSSLAGVAALFRSEGVLLAGWVHYLAFDLLVGTWIRGEARRLDVPHAAVVPCLLLTFLFGPIGWLAFMGLRLFRQRTAAAGVLAA